MGMTIDKAIAKIQHCIVSIKDCVGNKEFVEALKLSVEIMRKYQKIEQILDDCDLEAWEVLEMIRKVVEDGECK
jgi:hypothetical protein